MTIVISFNWTSFKHNCFYTLIILILNLIDHTFCKTNMKKIVVTGGSGFIGSNLIDYLLKKILCYQY